jgi:hypothetical protein
MSHNKTPESDTQSTRQDALRFLREATYNSLARVNSPRLDTPNTPTTPKRIVSDLNDSDTKVCFLVLHFSCMLIELSGYLRSILPVP